MQKVLAFIVLILMACHPENRRDSVPDTPGRSKHNPDIPQGDKYSIPAHKDADTGNLPSWKHTAANDSLPKIQHDTNNINH